MKDNLNKQLISSGASREEAEAMAKIADSLNASVPHRLSADSKSRIKQDLGIKKTFAVPKLVIAGASSFAIAAVIALSQSALPGSVLYPVKRSGEKAREVVQPSYSEQLIEIRRQEVDQLKAESAEEIRIKEAEDEYQKALESKTKKSRSNEEPEPARDERDVRGWSDRRRDNSDDSRDQRRGDWRRDDR